jgi:hypothetical protein
MADKWEMCLFDAYNYKVNFCVPQREPVEINFPDYAKAKGLRGGWMDIYTHLLAEGWEPFAAVGETWPNVVFRRKVTA